MNAENNAENDEVMLKLKTKMLFLMVKMYKFLAHFLLTY